MWLVDAFVQPARDHLSLQPLRHWLACNNPVIMTVLLVVIGSKILGDAISGLS